MGLCGHHHDRLDHNKRRRSSSAAKCIAAGNDLVMPGTDTDRREILDALSAENDQYLEEKDLTACAQRILEMILLPIHMNNAAFSGIK